MNAANINAARNEQARNMIADMAIAAAKYDAIAIAASPSEFVIRNEGVHIEAEAIESEINNGKTLGAGVRPLRDVKRYTKAQATAFAARIRNGRGTVAQAVSLKIAAQDAAREAREVIEMIVKHNPEVDA